MVDSRVSSAVMTAAQPKKVAWLIMLYVAADDLRHKSADYASIADQCNRMMNEVATLTFDADVAVVALTDDNLRDAGKYPNIVPGLKRLAPNPALASYKRRDGRKPARHIWAPIPQNEHPDGLLEFIPPDSKPEINTGRPYTLAMFIDWALTQYDPEHTMLAIIGHGGGWSPSFVYDDRSLHSWVPWEPPRGAPAIRDNSDRDAWMKNGGGHSPSMNGLCPDNTRMPDDGLPPIGLSTTGLAYGLRAGLSRLNERHHEPAKKLDVLFLDACLMAMIEVAYEVRNCAHYVVAGEDLLWASLPYRNYLRSLTGTTSAEALAVSIAEKYNKKYHVQRSWAISVIDTAHLEALKREVDQLAAELITAIHTDPSVLLWIFLAYRQAQKFDYNGDEVIGQNENYVDLFDFAGKLATQLRVYALRPGSPPTKANVETACQIATQITDTIGNGWAPAAELDENLRSCYEQRGGRVVRYARAQTHRNEGAIRNLDQAHGISIYLPLGHIDRRGAVRLRKTEAAHKKRLRDHVTFGNKSFIDLYKTQLAFADNNAWPHLLSLLAAEFFQEDPSGDNRPIRNVWHYQRDPRSKHRG